MRYSTHLCVALLMVAGGAGISRARLPAPSGGSVTATTAPTDKSGVSAPAGRAAPTLSGIDLKRSDAADVVILRSLDKVLGRITNRQYVLRTLLPGLKEVKAPAGEVIGLLSRSARSNEVHLVLAGGQVIAGELISGPIVVKLAGGTELKVLPKGLLQAAYRISPAKPRDIAITDSQVVFRSGVRLAFDDAGMTFEFLTPHGALPLAAGDLQYIEMDTPAGGLHRAVFRNGSVLAGLLAAESLRLKLKLASTAPAAGGSTAPAAGATPVEIPRQQVRQFVFLTPPAASKDLAVLTFRNTDVIYGRITDEKWTVRSKFGSVAVVPSRIAEAKFAATISAAAPGQVKLTLRDGTRLGGGLADGYVGFKIEPGPALKIFVGHIKSIAGPARSAAPTTSPSPSAEAPTARRLKCLKCAREWTVGPEEAASLRVGTNARPVGADCPHCGAKGTVFEMTRCPVCGAYYLSKRITDPKAFAGGKVRDVCPKCGTDIMEWRTKHRRGIRVHGAISP